MAKGTGDAYPGEQRLSGNLITLFKYMKGWKREQTFFGGILKGTATEIHRLR